MENLRVSNLAAPESDLSSADESCDLLDAVVGGVCKTLYERNHDHNPFNDGLRRGIQFDRPFVDEFGPNR